MTWVHTWLHIKQFEVEGRFPVGGPKKTWNEVLKQDQESKGHHWKVSHNLVDWWPAIRWQKLIYINMEAAFQNDGEAVMKRCQCRLNFTKNATNVIIIITVQVRQGRTTIIVAHRLSTIRSADKIVALNKGLVAEEGTHKELMQRKSFYYNLVTAQIPPSERKASKGKWNASTKTFMLPSYKMNQLNYVIS